MRNALFYLSLRECSALNILAVLLSWIYEVVQKGEASIWNCNRRIDYHKVS